LIVSLISPSYASESIIYSRITGNTPVRRPHSVSEFVIQAVDKDLEVRQRVDKLRRAKDRTTLGFGRARAASKRNGKDKQARLRKYTPGLAAFIAMLAIVSARGSRGLSGRQAAGW
jgi:hypothetical protein